jgi:phage-related protein
MNGAERPVVWLDSCRRDLRSFPSEVRREIGAALYAAQQGDTDPAARPMKGFGGASVLEIVSAYRGDTWRAVYTIRFPEAVLRTPRVSEKIKARDCHAKTGDRSDQTPPGRSRAPASRKAELT